MVRKASEAEAAGAASAEPYAALSIRSLLFCSVFLALLLIFEDVLVGHLSDAHGTYALGVNDRDDLVYHREIMQGDVQVLADEEVQTALPPVIAHVLGTDVAVSEALRICDSMVSMRTLVL